MKLARFTAPIVALSVFALAACGGGSSSSSSGGNGAGATPATKTDVFAGIKQDDKLRAMLPKKYTDSGTFTFATDGNGPPRTFVDDKGVVVGFIPDLMHAAGIKLGLESKVERVSFDAEVPGVQSGRFDIAADTGDFPPRRKIVDLVDYLKAGSAFIVQKGNPKNVSDLDSLCGLKVAVTSATNQEQVSHDQSDKCTKDGKKPIDLLVIPTGALEVPLQAGRVDVAFGNTSTAVLLATEHPDQFAIGGDLMFQAYLALSIDKGNSGFRDAMQGALQSLLDDGTYQDLLDKWKQGDLAVEKITLNTDAPGVGG
jgi:polar amino acid transport system substrate-binding protein